MRLQNCRNKFNRFIKRTCLQLHGPKTTGGMVDWCRQATWCNSYNSATELKRKALIVLLLFLPSKHENFDANYCNTNMNQNLISLLQLVYTGITSWTWMLVHLAQLQKTLQTARGNARRMTSVMSSSTIQGNNWHASQFGYISLWEYLEVSWHWTKVNLSSSYEK